MKNPYKNSADYQMWRRAVSRVESHDINPVTKPRFQIDVADRLATAGSCFAQHISKRISEIGFNYYCPEMNEDLDATEAKKQNYGVFSARYGNIYTVQQLNQLFQESVDGQPKHEMFWKKGEAFFDPYRPNIFPNGFESLDHLTSERDTHLSCVREMFENCDVFVFTLGLTEGWRSKVDGSAFPLAPGVIAGEYDPSMHEFFNSSIDETREELFSFIDSLVACNPKVKVLLTVSPVPLIATYEDRHVLASTIYSKSVLRVAAQEAYDKYSCVDYFPSFEIITGSPTGGMYFEDDMREVNSVGVSHAMRCFLAAYTSKNLPIQLSENEHVITDYNSASEIVCDEEEIEKSFNS